MHLWNNRYWVGRTHYEISLFFLNCRCHMWHGNDLLGPHITAPTSRFFRLWPTEKLRADQSSKCAWKCSQTLIAKWNICLTQWFKLKMKCSSQVVFCSYSIKKTSRGSNKLICTELECNTFNNVHIYILFKKPYKFYVFLDFMKTQDLNELIFFWNPCILI